MASSRNTYAPPGSFPPAALAEAVARTRRRLLGSLDAAAEARCLRLDVRPFADVAEALDALEAAARAADAERGA